MLSSYRPSWAAVGRFATVAAVTSSTRAISSSVARCLLGLENHTKIELNDIRKAYFAAAKQCHPDLQRGRTAKDFLELTKAYEFLQQEISGTNLAAEVITYDEEVDFREACQTQLGVPAEIVEECKQSPIFRRWLVGRTDSAHLWSSFLQQNGGLAPKLRTAAISTGTDVATRAPRRSRRPR